MGELPGNGDDELELLIDTNTLAPSPHRQELRLDRPCYLRDVLEIHVLAFLDAIHREFPLLNEAFQGPPFPIAPRNGKLDQSIVTLLPDHKAHNVQDNKLEFQTIPLTSPKNTTCRRILPFPMTYMPTKLQADIRQAIFFLCAIVSNYDSGSVYPETKNFLIDDSSPSLGVRGSHSAKQDHSSIHRSLDTLTTR